MCGHHDQRTVADAPTKAHDVPDVVPLHIIKSVRPKHVEIDDCALVFLERRRWNFGQRDDVSDGLLVF